MSKITWAEQHRLNALHAAYPMSGDYWEEMFCVYFVVLEPVIGGAIVIDVIQNRKGQELDYSKAEFKSTDQILKSCRYSSIDGWVADVHPAALTWVVEKWRELGSPMAEDKEAACKPFRPSSG